MKATSISSDPSPFHRLENGTYFDGIAEHDAMTQLIDSYRLRIDDELMYRGERRGKYSEEQDPLEDFQRYLDRAEKRGGVLPKWWSKEKRQACEEQAMRQSEWCCLLYSVEKPDIVEHYKNPLKPMQLRMVAEMVEGSNVMA